MQYAIYEGNMDRLEKKLAYIYNKCKTYGCDFHYEVVGETFKEVKDSSGHKVMARFLLVEAEGKAVVNGWEFAAAVEHTDKGNIFSGILGIEIPQKYYTSPPVCEHCNTNRFRKYTYIVRNKETGEFKQVGKACLKDYTHGMSAEMVAQYISLFDTLIQGEAPEPTARIERYLDVKEYLRFAAETIRYYGYIKSGDDRQSTGLKALDFYEASRGRAVAREYLEDLRAEMDSVGFNPDSEQARKDVEDALAWIKEQRESSTYIHNLKTACTLDYTVYKNYGLLASLFAAYRRDMERIRQRGETDESKSVYVGTVNGKVTVDVTSVRCMSSWDGQYGTTRLYKIIGKDGNTYTWKTGKVLPEKFDSMVITGKVKGHSEFRGIKQTDLTYCQAKIIS